MKSGTHLEESLRRDIELIRSKVSEMGQLAEIALRNSLEALLRNDRQTAYSVILRDQWMDEAEKQLDRLCLEFLVRQIPAGAHLRFVYAALKINNELERIGDYAESIARQVLKLVEVRPKPDLEPMRRLAELSTQMLHDTVEAFLQQDAARARAAMRMEDQADLLRDQINAQLMQLRQDNQLPLEALTPYLTIARRYERVSDQAKNICEEVLYMCTGEYSKHKGTETLRILFLDERNACRSIMAEAIGRSLGLSEFQFCSAGLSPAEVDPRTLEFLSREGIDAGGLASKPVQECGPLDHFQVIVTLSKSAESVLPPPPTKTVALDWNVADPSRAAGTPAEVEAAYRATYNFIRTHIRELIQAILGRSFE